MINLFLRIFAKRRRELALAEIEIFKSEMKNQAREEFVTAKIEMTRSLETIMKEHITRYQSYADEIKHGATSCANDIKKQEHDFHKDSAERNAVIKVLYAHIEFLESKHRYIQEIVDAEESIKSSMMLLLSEKQDEINKLSRALDKLTN